MAHAPEHEHTISEEPEQIIEGMYAKLAELERVMNETEETLGIKDEL